MRNPFATARFAPGVLPWIGGGDIERHLDRVCVRGARFQILGAHGSGKSTLLVHLERGATLRGWDVVRFRGSRGIVVPPYGSLVLADEAEEIGALGLLFLRAASTSLVVTAHRDLGLPTLCERNVDVGTLRALIAVLDPTNVPPEVVLADLLARHRGNVRDVFFDLYDAVEDRRAGNFAPAPAERYDESRHA